MLGVPLDPATTGRRRLLVIVVAAALLVAATLTAGGRPAAAVTGDLRMHDPSVIRVGDCFYGFSTGFEDGPSNGAVTIRKTCDASLYAGWTFVGTVWDTPPAWITRRLGQTPPNFWAPDINFFNGKYHLYYAASIWGKPGATMGLLTATDIEGPWTDAGEVTSVNYPIDPNVAWSGDTPYVMWGSWNGIYLHVLDGSTGKLSTTDHNLWKLATGIENPTIARDGGYYYLFGSRGSCCVGVNSTYFTVVGRSEKISGPYLDRNGVDLARGGGTMVMRGKGTQVAAGGADLFTDGPATRLAYHFYDATAAGRETLNVRRVDFVDGWPQVAQPVGEYPASNVRLTQAQSGQVLAGAPAGNGVVTTGWTGGPGEQWQLEDVGGGYSRVVNRLTGTCLDVANGSIAEGAGVLRWTCGYGHNQQWGTVPVGKNLQLVARHSGKCLAVLPAAGQAGPAVVQQTCAGNARHQLWTRQVTDPAVPAPPVRHEAEAKHNTRSGGAVVSDCAHCSGHTKVRSIGNGGPSALTFNAVTAEATGSVLLTIAYTNGSVAAREAELQVNGAQPTKVSFPHTGSASRPGHVSVIVSLTRGANTVRIGSATGSGPDLDGITVGPLPGS